MKILNSIKKRNFYETLIYLNKKQYKKLKEYYGEKWYTFFFNKHHLDKQKETIIKNLNKKNS